MVGGRFHTAQIDGHPVNGTAASGPRQIFPASTQPYSQILQMGQLLGTP